MMTVEASETADPFAEEAGGDPFAEEEGAALPAEEKPPPVVNREGERVEEGASDAGKRMAAEAEAKAEAEAAAPQETETAPEPPQETPAAAQESGGQPRAESAPRKRGEGTKRLYKLLYQTGKAQWTEAPLDDWGESEYVVTVDGEKWISATTADQVRRLGFVFFQRPQDGVTLLPVAQGAWKPVRVKAKQVPTRERLEFESA